MAQKTPNFVQTMDEILSHAVNKGVLHLKDEGDVSDGRFLVIDGKKKVNFGSYSYLGLELHPKVKEGIIQATLAHGAQFPASRAYISSAMYFELEELLGKIYDAPVIVSPSTTLSHLSFIPAMIENEDAVILDHQVHATVQTPVQFAKAKGTHVEMIRHNDMEALEQKIKELSAKHQRVWYMADSVYSMYGDVAPFDSIKELLNKYERFHAYIDDAHGMSWYGENGKGLAISRMGFHPRCFFAASLSKGFGVCGGVLIFPDEESHRKVRTCGGSLIFTGPLGPPMLGGDIACAKIHLTDEIYDLQNKLQVRMRYFNDLLRETNLPLVAETQCPIFYIGMGLPRVGQNMVKRLLNDGFYVNLGMFPAVPVKNTGLRISLCVHQELEDIKNLTEAMQYHFPKVLEEEKRTLEDIHKAFRMSGASTDKNYHVQFRYEGKLLLKYENTIHNIPAPEWNEMFAGRGVFDWRGMQFLEETFKNNPRKENNNKFHYFIIRDSLQKPIVATFFSQTWIKDDMLASPDVSATLEKMRREGEDPYLHCSPVLMTGNVMTEGEHLFIDRSNPLWREAMQLLIEEAAGIVENEKLAQIVLRDFDPEDAEMQDFLFNQGFLSVAMPSSNILPIDWQSEEEYLEKLSSFNRYRVRRDAVKRENDFIVEVISESNLNEADAEHFHNIYRNVNDNNLGLNLFTLPKRAIVNVARARGWEIIVLYLKSEPEKAIAMGYSYLTENGESYVTAFLGMDYNYVFSHRIYQQMLWQAIKRAKSLGCKNIRLGLTSDIEKQKFGAREKKNVLYVQNRDNYSFEAIEAMSVKEKHVKKK
jgi:7-keto-8-aminopelargonate synthetase-like enzyme